eukprot:TRINITY_DN14437_c0_g1_i4.p1 TRINITY_DN14437_c0_g1~~TRINITY_DN14437_c0_g1_i4.p1  ORF type:complete len:245 (-),score=16.36 TRINITY_DN14437_c0_g1_i4:74-808(-)
MTQLFFVDNTQVFVDVIYLHKAAVPDSWRASATCRSFMVPCTCTRPLAGSLEGIGYITMELIYVSQLVEGVNWDFPAWFNVAHDGWAAGTIPVRGDSAQCLSQILVCSSRVIHLTSCSSCSSLALSSNCSGYSTPKLHADDMIGGSFQHTIAACSGCAGLYRFLGAAAWCFTSSRCIWVRWSSPLPIRCSGQLCGFRAGELVDLRGPWNWRGTLLSNVAGTWCSSLWWRSFVEVFADAPIVAVH